MAAERLNPKRTTVEVFDINKGSRSEVEVRPGLSDQYTEFLESVADGFRNDLDFLGSLGKLKSHGRRRSKREIRDIRNRLPDPEDMRNFLNTLEGAGDKHIQLLVGEGGSILGFNLKDRKTEE